MPKETYVPRLFALFQQYGYDGATLAKISEATGLGKASLYHHFPGGKDEMVVSVLGYSQSWLEGNVLQILRGEGTPAMRLQTMCDRVNELYAGGTSPCLLAILQSGTGRSTFHAQIKLTLQNWIAAIATVLTEAGFEAGEARQRGEDALIAIQGALMLSQGLDASEIFQRSLQALPKTLLQA
ncbi:MAG: TetR/AcrR family transcriptional regulator [Leptolyngbyaceae cyanobacterium]